MRFIFSLMAMLVISACSNDQKPKVQAKMNVRETAKVLLELRLANAAYNLYYNQMPDSNQKWMPYQTEIFQRLKIQPEDFSSSMKIHAESPDSILMMDSLVLVQLEQKSRKEIQPSIDAHHPIKKYKGKIHKERSE